MLSGDTFNISGENKVPFVFHGGAVGGVGAKRERNLVSLMDIVQQKMKNAYISLKE